jgi:hypothetical protein
MKIGFSRRNIIFATPENSIQLPGIVSGLPLSSQLQYNSTSGLTVTSLEDDFDSHHIQANIVMSRAAKAMSIVLRIGEVAFAGVSLFLV